MRTVQKWRDFDCCRFSCSVQQDELQARGRRLSKKVENYNGFANRRLLDITDGVDSMFFYVIVPFWPLSSGNELFGWLLCASTRRSPFFLVCGFSCTELIPEGDSKNEDPTKTCTCIVVRKNVCLTPENGCPFICHNFEMKVPS